jgi:virginiamycin B lyase
MPPQLESMRRSRTAKLLTAAIVAAGLLTLPAPALAQRCTLGYDIGLSQDRDPSLCSFFNLPAGQAGFPITSGPDGRVWFFVRDHGALYAAKMTTSGQVERFQLPDGSTPDAITAGPDGGLWYAGDGRIGRLDTAGNVTEFPVDSLRATGIAPGPDGALWVAAGTTVVRVTPQGEVSVIPLVGGNVVPLPSLTRTQNATASHVIGSYGNGGTTHGITAGGDGAMWIAAGSHLARVTPAGDVTSVSLPRSLPADGGITTAADGKIWFSAGGDRFDQAGSSVGRYDPAGGGVQSFGLSGRALDVVRGPGSANVWVSTASDSGRLNWITRLSTQAFGPAKPRQWSCAGQTAAACWFHIPAVPLGDQRLFNTHARPGGVTVGPDGNVWYTEGGKIGRIRTFRGAMPCYERVTRNHNFGCGRNNNHAAKVTHSGFAYLRTTCPYLTFRVCQGDVVLRTTGGRFIGRAVYIIAHYDNPRVRTQVPRWMLNQIKRHGRVLVDATYTSQDMGGLKKVNRGTWYLSFTG